MSVVIRRLQPAHKEGWRALWRGYQDFYEVNLHADEERLWAALMEPEADGPFAFVGELDGDLVGLVQYLAHITTWDGRKRIYLNDLFTNDAARGKGVGKTLIEAVYQDGRNMNCDQVYWTTQHFNDTARSLYDKMADLTPFIKYAKPL